MTVLMMFAACYGVWQLTMLASATRTVRMPLLILGVVTGLYGAGMLALGLQLAYTRGVAALTGDSVAEIVRTASYTTDPLIEELAKVAPFALLALLHRKVRAQWGLTDFLLLGAASGAGFALVEQLLRHAGEAANAARAGRSRAGRSCGASASSRSGACPTC
ncbi:PrsW family glutamic-type intramembrane protease [Catellatospora bangladeshensis]|uniref:PrsW family glutamic-type intramembrane protease n=1 Tax=Catellatospora bangladeshensis TaxID=310355 RepID=UPI0036184BB1